MCQSDHLQPSDREEATKEGDFTLNDEDDDDNGDDDQEEWDGETWTNEGEDAEDVKDESAAYLEFLKEEVSQSARLRSESAKGENQSEKFGAAQDESDDELEEETLLETPLDKIEPYGMFKATLFSMFGPNDYLPLYD